MNPEPFDTPLVVVTVTSTVDAPVTAGETQEIEVEEWNTTELAAMSPKATVAPLTIVVPVIVTAVPPAIGPEVALSDVIVGAGTAETFRVKDWDW